MLPVINTASPLLCTRHAAHGSLRIARLGQPVLVTIRAMGDTAAPTTPRIAKRPMVADDDRLAPGMPDLTGGAAVRVTESLERYRPPDDPGPVVRRQLDACCLG